MNYYINKSDLDYFAFGGTSSTSFNFVITECDNLNSFENDIELIEIQGKSGDLLIDNKRKKNKEINIEGFVDCEGLGDAKTVSRSINTWLVGEVAYKPLTFSNDLVKYQAIVIGKVETIEVIKNLLSVKFKFSVKEDANG